MTKLSDLKTERDRLTGEVREKTATYIAGGLGIVVGLAWNDAIKGLIDYIFPFANGSSLFAKFLYAIILTIIVVVVTMYVFRKAEEEK